MVLRNFLWFVKENNFPEIYGLNAVHIRHFLWYLSNETHRWGDRTSNVKKPACQTTVNGYYRALNSFFNWLVKEQLVKENPMSGLKKPRPEKKVVQALTKQEIDRLFSVCNGRLIKDLRNKAILSIFLDCGLRFSELTNLKMKDVNMDDGSILVRHGEGNKQRIVRVGTKAQKALWKYLMFRKSDSDALFINRSCGPLELIGVKALIHAMGRKARVEVYPHKLRHTFAVSFLRAGGDVFSLKYLLGHSTLTMTQRYVQSLTADDAANAHRKFSPLDNMN